MKKNLIWFRILLITLLLTAPVSYAVLFKERIRKNTLIDRQEAYYLSLQTDLFNFRQSQDKLISEQTSKNIKAMADAKTTYEYLLSQQEKLISANSTYVQVSQPSTPSTTTVSKPKTTTKTKTS